MHAKRLRTLMNTEQKTNGDSLFDALPGWARFLVVAGSGFIAGLALTAESFVTIQHRRSTVIGLALCLILIFAVTRRRYPAFANLALWSASFCIALIVVSGPQPAGLPVHVPAKPVS